MAATATISSHVAVRSSSTRPTRMTWLSTSMPRWRRSSLAKAPAATREVLFAGGGALKNVTRVGEVIFERAGEIGVARTRRGYGLMLSRIAGFDGQLLFPVLPVAVNDLDGDGRADGFAVAHTAEDMDLSVSIFMRPPRP